MSNSLSDEKAILLVSEYAKTDQRAMRLLVRLIDTDEFGERDMVISRIHYYLKECNICE